MLRWRLLLGVLFAAVLVGLLAVDFRWQPPGVVLVPVVIFVAAMSTAELLGLLAGRGLSASPQVVYPANVLLVLAAGVGAWSRQPADAAVGQTWAFAIVTVATMAALIDEMRRYRAPGQSLERLSATMLSVAYVGVTLSFLVSLRMAGGGGWGTLAIVSLLVVVKFSDIGAYTIGRLVGRHRMAPTLSPGKTIEGAAGALAFGVVGAWLSLVWLAPLMLPAAVPHSHPVVRSSATHLHDSQEQPLRHTTPIPAASAETPRTPLAAWRWIVYGVVLTVAGMMGDLAESLIKRDAGVKDSSRWMPGFGGVLDLVDSVLLAAPVAYWCWSWGLVGF